MSIPMSDSMPTISNFYRTVWQATARDQLVLIALSLVVAALAAVPLKFQQLAINSMVERSDIAHLVWLCAGYLAAALLGAGMKFALGYRQSIVGERAVRMIRDRLYSNSVGDAAASAVGFPKRGSLVTMITSEAEAVGPFAGASISAPLSLAGTLVSVLGFIFVTQPLLGILALAVVLPQAVVVSLIQRRVNEKFGARVQALRDASDRISESDLKQIEAEIVADFNTIFAVRREIFLLKQTTKFALRLLSTIGTVGFLLLGGWLVIGGRTDVGTVVAGVTGLTRIEGPWRELISFFRSLGTVRVQFGMLLKVMAQGG